MTTEPSEPACYTPIGSSRPSGPFGGGKKRRAARVVLIASLVGVTILAAIEAGLRRWAPPFFSIPELPQLGDCVEPDSLLGWRVKPNLKDVRISGVLTSQPVDFTLNTNSLGLRGPDVGPKGDRCRILVLGDSTTFGVGVDDVDTYPARVEQLLNEKRPLGRRYQVVNAAGLAYKSWQGLRYLSERGLRLQPDLVIAAFGNCEVDVDDLDIPSQLTGGALRDVLMKSRLVMLTWEKLVKLCSPETTPLLSADARRSRVEQLFGNALLDMWRVCDSNEATLVLLLWPWSPQIYDPRCRSMPRDYEGFCAFLARNQYVLRDVAKETGVCLIDPCQALIAARSTSLYIDGAHVSPEGHDVIAHVIVEALRRSLLEQCATGPSHSPPVPVK